MVPCEPIAVTHDHIQGSVSLAGAGVHRRPLRIQHLHPGASGGRLQGYQQHLGGGSGRRPAIDAGSDPYPCNLLGSIVAQEDRIGPGRRAPGRGCAGPCRDLGPLWDAAAATALGLGAGSLLAGLPQLFWFHRARRRGQRMARPPRGRGGGSAPGRAGGRNHSCSDAGLSNGICHHWRDHRGGCPGTLATHEPSNTSLA